MKSKLKKIIPRKLLLLKRYVSNSLKIFGAGLYDYKRYIKYSGTSAQKTQNEVLGKMIAHYHVIEKGLSMREMRLGFGKTVIIDLLKLINDYIEHGYDTANTQFKTACSVLLVYLGEHEKKSSKCHPIEKIAAVRDVLEKFRTCDVGYRDVDKSEVIESINFDYENFFSSRYSIREFENSNVDLADVIDCLSVAQKYPSVCNRQAGRIYVVKDEIKVKEYLKYQNGNRGFGDYINKLLIITTDIGCFEGDKERNQAFIDGGIHLLSVLLSLHAKGVGAIALNWSMDVASDKTFRAFSGIPENEIIISFIGIGALKEKFKVPFSKRSEIDAIMKVI